MPLASKQFEQVTLIALNLNHAILNRSAAAAFLFSSAASFVSASSLSSIPLIRHTPLPARWSALNTYDTVPFRARLCRFGFINTAAVVEYQTAVGIAHHTPCSTMR